MKVLVTGGAGYIGSHTVVQLIEEGHEVIVFDNFCNASRESIKRVEKIVKQDIEVIEGDIRNAEDLSAVFTSHTIDAVIHFAGLKVVHESVEEPLKYYDNNVYGTIVLCDVMQKFGCKSIIFSSSATVYGDSKSVPITESSPTGATNPYGRSKLFVEEILKDLYVSDKTWKVILLRYFNPVGAHKSGTIGENPNGVPNNLMPYITQTAVGKRKSLQVYGSDYRTVDGTGVRDYIHVVDLANGHLKALSKMQDDIGVLTVNLGTGIGYSVLEMVQAFEKASGQKIPYEIVGRRAGDIDQCYADTTLAEKVLGWKASKDLSEMCEDSWRWQKNNPMGYM